METELSEETPPKERVVSRASSPAFKTLRCAAHPIANQAVSQAIAYCKARGATNIVKLGKPYDIKLRLDGEERHIEVKGRSITIETVELTINEVMHATDYPPTDLVVVDAIHRKPGGTGKFVTSDGRFRRLAGRPPLDEDYATRRFA